MRSYFHNAICIPFLICSKCHSDADPIVSKHVAVWILYKVVFDGYFIVQHNRIHNNNKKQQSGCRILRCKQN